MSYWGCPPGASTFPLGIGVSGLRATSEKMFQAWGLLSGRCVQVHTDLRRHMKSPCSPPRLQTVHGTRLTLCPSVQTRNALQVLAPKSSGQHPASEWTGKWETSGTCVHSPNSWAHLLKRWEPITYPAWGSVAFGFKWHLGHVLLWTWQDRWLRMWPHTLPGVKQVPSEFSVSRGSTWRAPPRVPQSSLVLLQIGIRCDSCRTAAEHHPAINLIPPRGRWAAPMMKLKVVFSH